MPCINKLYLLSMFYISRSYRKTFYFRDFFEKTWRHISVMASNITTKLIVCSTACAVQLQGNHQRTALLSLTGICRSTGDRWRLIVIALYDWSICYPHAHPKLDATCTPSTFEVPWHSSRSCRSFWMTSSGTKRYSLESPLRNFVQNMCNGAVITAPADGLVPWGARPSAGTVVTTCGPVYARKRHVKG